MSDGIDKLTSRMAAGDGRAVEMFYRHYFGWLYAQARRVTGRDESFCLDVVQDTVLRILRNVQAVETEGQLKAWMLLVINTTALDRLRADGRRVRRELAIAGRRDKWSHADEHSEQEQIDMLRRQISMLDPQLIAMIDLRYQRGWSLQRVAEAMGLSIGTIDGRLRRTLSMLRDQVCEDDNV